MLMGSCALDQPLLYVRPIALMMDKSKPRWETKIITLNFMPAL